MNKIFFIFFILALSIRISEASKNVSRWDTRYETFARSNPIGAYARAEFGYSLPLWGKYDLQKPLYGFVRPMARFQTSGLVNNVMGGIEFNPISFLSFFVAKSYMRRDLKKLDNFDCETITCKSSDIERNIWGLKFALKFGNVFMLNRLQWHTTSIGNNQSLGFADEQGTLIGSGTKDKLFQSVQVLGVDLSKSHGFGVLHKRNATANSRQDSTMLVALYKYVYWDKANIDWNILSGPGVFHTRQGTDHPMLFFLLQYRPQKGWALF
ncbi:MAG: hypothetical protein K9K67_13500 [Bacteriovoracaceae bacterium]|nr:hypothetical protein [Bacteriovoracaceae bacterium]